jgi:hypothetical protein
MLIAALAVILFGVDLLIIEAYAKGQYDPVMADNALPDTIHTFYSNWIQSQVMCAMVAVLAGSTAWYFRVKPNQR